MSNKVNYWRKPPEILQGTNVAVRYVICNVCGRTIGGAITGFDGEQVAKEMRYVAREHHKASGHSAFFFADGIRRERGTRKRRVPSVQEDEGDQVS